MTPERCKERESKPSEGHSPTESVDYVVYDECSNIVEIVGLSDTVVVASIGKFTPHFRFGFA